MFKNFFLIALLAFATNTFANPGPLHHDADFETHNVANFEYRPVNTGNSWDFTNMTAMTLEIFFHMNL